MWASMPTIQNANNQEQTNNQNFKFFCLAPKSPTHTGLVCVKNSSTNISCLDPFKGKVFRLSKKSYENGVVLCSEAFQMSLNRW
jgi:hypothetical protein